MKNYYIFKFCMVAILFLAKTVTLNAQDVNTPWSLIAFENEKEVAVYNIEMIGNIEITVQNLTVVLDDGAIFSHPIATTTFGFDARNQALSHEVIKYVDKRITNQ